ncbi:MAG: hypothetical protein CBE00_08165 [Planctomycetaceae bacterium TMED240]|nr:hypothetical protein [Rhodopirellula sp.]OUX06236.1 MAG: hypothetical protein CBE00_08165 [Planctomycetaceae bacterium TMED240]
MFGSRRKKTQHTIDWPTLQALLEDDDRRAAIEYTYPTDRRDSFLQATRQLAPKLVHDLLATGRQVHTAERLIDWPTVAVAGMLNSGKTSLVATFLSKAGQARTLRGANNNQGTHRFVLWLPAAWEQDAELWALLMERMGNALGKRPEILSADPETAHRQYNNKDGNAEALAVPLIATDPALNSIGIGLLDCPDIVSDAEFGLGSPEARRELLGRAASLCSAFLVVASAESSRDSTLGDLLRMAADLMPGVPRMLAVNKVRPQQTPDLVYETFQPLARSNGIETIYAAYDFEVPGSVPFIPKLKDEILTEEVTHCDRLPVFFSIVEGSNNNPPACIPEDRLLISLPTKLDRGQLFEKFSQALTSSLRNVIWEEAYVMLDRDSSAAQRATDKAQQCLLDAALDFFAHRQIGGEVTELRLHQSERILRQLMDSFSATAPWYARLGVKLNTRLRVIFGGASDLLKQLTPSALAKRTAGEIKDKFQRGEYGGLMTPETLGSSLERYDGALNLPHWRMPDGNSLDEKRWLQACEDAIQRFERDDFTALDARRLDEAVREMWKEIPAHKKLVAGLTPLALMLAAFGAVLMIPIDGGGTTLVMSASIPELLAAAGLTTLSTFWAGGRNTKNVGQQAARQQLADFHAVLCDTFGVARMAEPTMIRIAGGNEKVLPSKIVVRDAVECTMQLYHIRDEFLKELQRSVPRNGPASP